jgi:soluble lytic murein transglycosylase
MMQAFAAANKGDWVKARTYAAATGDPVFNTLLQWRYLADSGIAAPFEEINSFLAAHPNWPRRDAMLAAAERNMPAVFDAPQVIAWYGTREPVTSVGRIRFGEALMATGEHDRGAQFIRKAWIEGNFGVTDETEILQAHSDVLSQNDHRARLDQLLARADTMGARRQLPRLDADSQTIANARLKIEASPATAQAVFTSVPDALKSDAGLRFDTARALRRRGQDQDAWAMLANAAPAQASAGLADARWTERHIMTRDAFKAGKYDLAYRLVSAHGLSAGGNFADAEFLAGWIALRFLHRPEWALDHFRALTNSVVLPISKARGSYWLARTEEELGQKADAIASYRKSAEYQETFYGQLALARIEEAPVHKLQASLAAPTREEEQAFDADERVAAIRMLADIGDRDRFRLFAIRVAADANDPKRLRLLAQMMMSLDDPAMSVRVAKLGSYNGVSAMTFLAPTMAIPRFPGAGAPPEPALVLGLTRQESEFDTKAVSSAGARGLMQLMPASARKAAKQHGLVYRLGDLVAKPQYNMQLGMATLSDYLDHWGGSYILAIASYNAGEGNVTRWVENFGDPRDPTIDPIDWIEQIPFSETRNYVQRVLENVGIYRNRLSGRDQKLAIMADLYRPNAPKISVLKYEPPKPVEPPPEQAASAAPLPGALPAPVDAPIALPPPAAR